MKLWKWVVEHTFPGTYDEYLEARVIHFQELRTYRRNWQFIVGLLLVTIPVITLCLKGGGWGCILALCIAAGFVFVHDAITEHYCALVNRERKHFRNAPE